MFDSSEQAIARRHPGTTADQRRMSKYDSLAQGRRQKGWPSLSTCSRSGGALGGVALCHHQAAGTIDDKERCALWNLHSSIVSLLRSQERVDVDRPSYRSGAGDGMLMLVPGLLLRGRTSYVAAATKLPPPCLYADEPLQVEAAGGGMIGKSKGTRTMARPV